MPRDKPASEASDYSLSGLHKTVEHAGWLHASDVVEVAAVLSASGGKCLVLSVKLLAEFETALRQLGKALYTRHVPYVVLGCRLQKSPSPEPQLVFDVVVSDPKSTFDLLCAAGFGPDPMRSLAVTGRRGVVCIRLLEGKRFAHK
jgi:hypothetical protein